MPTKCGLKDKKGYFCRWGGSGKKYYYDPNDKASKERARKKANKQGQAAHANKSDENDEFKVIIEQKEPFIGTKESNLPKNDQKEAKCADCEPKLDEIDEKEPKSAENEQKSAKIDENKQELAEKTPKYEVPEAKNDLNEGHFVRFKDKIGKIIKVIE